MLVHSSFFPLCSFCLSPFVSLPALSHRPISFFLPFHRFFSFTLALLYQSFHSASSPSFSLFLNPLSFTHFIFYFCRTLSIFCLSRSPPSHSFSLFIHHFSLSSLLFKIHNFEVSQLLWPQWKTLWNMQTLFNGQIKLEKRKVLICLETSIHPYNLL